MKTIYADAAILGAGVSGLVAARIIQQSGYENILIVDQYSRIGGNHINCDVGPFTFDIGTLIFQDDSPFMKYFPELLHYYHPIDWSISRIDPDNAIRDYPISMKDEVYGAGLRELLLLFGSIAKARCRFRPFANADEYARYWIGSRLFERSGLAHYIQRFYGVPGTAIDPVFAKKRMGWLEQGASVWKYARRLLNNSAKMQTSNQSFVRPRGGFNELYAVARQTLEQQGVQFALDENILSVSRKDTAFSIVTEDHNIVCRQIVSTIPVDRMYKLCGLGDPEPLPFSTLVSLFFCFIGDRGFESNILYNFSKQGDWKRLTMFSDFFGLAEGQAYFGVEVTSPEDELIHVEHAAALFQADVGAKGLFKGTLTFVGSHVLEKAYPVYTHGASERADQMIANLRQFGVRSMGRQGGFDYLPTARQVTLAVEAAMQGHLKAAANFTPPT